MGSQEGCQRRDFASLDVNTEAMGTVKITMVLWSVAKGIGSTRFTHIHNDRTATLPHFHGYTITVSISLREQYPQFSPKSRFTHILSMCTDFYRGITRSIQ